ncbi:MAG: DUF3566 domain-containing protein [Actinobacteria bacterium]|nr:DUF3566 domain-containing protein [Actinomycetota bacterium]
MAVERKVLRSVSELSMFKYLLIFYLIFFVVAVIIMAIIGLLTWLGFAVSGVSLNDIFGSLGLGNYGRFLNFAGGGVMGIVLVVIAGLVASVLYAAVGTFAVWIMNIVLRISGGIELRFMERESK